MPTEQQRQQRAALLGVIPETGENQIPFRLLEEWGANANSLSGSVAMGSQFKSFLMPSSAASCADTGFSGLPRKREEWLETKAPSELAAAAAGR